MTKDEALKLAMEALEEINKLSIGENAICLPAEIDTAMDAIKEALANDALERKAENARELGLNYEPEPWSNVGIGVDVTKEGVSVVGIYKLSNDSSHLFYSQFYTTPPQRTWVGLTDEEMDAIYEQHHNQYGECESANLGYERAIEAKLKEKNT